MTGDLWGEDVARGYDDSTDPRFGPEVLGATCDVLADLAGTGRALEFAIGTGRVGLALAVRGVPVAGIELSEAMASRLRAKDVDSRVELVLGDMATTRVRGQFSLVYLVYNTITNLLEQDEQVECFVNAAAHLAPGGYFLVEVGIPSLQRLPPGETARPFQLDRDHLGFDSYDLVACRLTSHHYSFAPDGTVSTFESHHRYAWPAEYDLMARIAGLEPHARWADWDRSEFTASSRSHVSVWRKPLS
ncbi:methyltransferase domain-containing protein [Kineococcus sp. SYSU DK003]|uniref:methyltransferase domain-containing protein n=1 Tax=Kineococcus sp. SYSU DK003 TaxID=3383124 RepID=UPI003D7D9913